MLNAELGIEQAEEVVNFRDGADGGFAAATRDPLLDGDRGREAGDEVEVGFLQLARKLAGIRGHRVEEATLAFGKDDVEGESGFPGSGEPGDNDKFVVGNGDLDVFEVVVAESVNGNLGLGNCVT